MNKTYFDEIKEEMKRKRTFSKNKDYDSFLVKDVYNSNLKQCAARSTFNRFDKAHTKSAFTLDTNRSSAKRSKLNVEEFLGGSNNLTSRKETRLPKNYMATDIKSLQKFLFKS